MKIWCDFKEKSEITVNERCKATVSTKILSSLIKSAAIRVIMASVYTLDVVVSELFDDLTEDLVFQRFGLQRSFKDLVRQLVDRARPFGRVVAHVLHHRWDKCQGVTQPGQLEYMNIWMWQSVFNLSDASDVKISWLKDIYEGHAGVLSQLLVVHDLLQQRLLERLSGAAPHLVLPTILSDHHPAQSVLGRRSGGSGGTWATRWRDGVQTHSTQSESIYVLWGWNCGPGACW